MTGSGSTAGNGHLVFSPCEEKRRCVITQEYWENLKITQKENITVGAFFKANTDRLKLTCVNGEIGFHRRITDKNLHRPGLALAGFVKLFRYDRIQVMGNTEVRYLSELSLEERKATFARILEFEIPCIIITCGNECDPTLIELATEKNVQIFQTPFETTKATYFIVDYLDDIFSPQTTIHGAFVDVYGVGLLFTGRSAIGKSEIALDLVERGHRLVADDVVIVVRKGEGILMGSGTKLIQHSMEIRGLGMLDVRSMFGIRSIRFQKRVEVIVHLEDWHSDQDYTRVGLEEEDTRDIMGVEIPFVRLPIFPGKNVTVISETIALNYLLKHYGYDASKAMASRLEEAIKRNESLEDTDRAIGWFEHDFE